MPRVKLRYGRTQRGLAPCCFALERDDSTSALIQGDTPRVQLARDLGRREHQRERDPINAASAWLHQRTDQTFNLDPDTLSAYHWR